MPDVNFDNLIVVAAVAFASPLLPGLAPELRVNCSGGPRAAAATP